MPTVVVELATRAIDWRLWASVLLGLIERARSISFDPDGVAAPLGVRREGLRLLYGEAGRPGSRYRLVTVHSPAPSTGLQADQHSASQLDPPIEIEIVADHAGELDLVVVTSELATTISVTEPRLPGSIAVAMSGTMHDLPTWLGQRIEVGGAIELDPTDRPRLSAHGGIERIQVSADADLVAGEDGDLLRVSVGIRPTGPLAAAVLAWPFVRGRAQREVEHAVAETWAAIDRELSNGRTVDELVEDAFRDSVEGIAEHVPADRA